MKPIETKNILLLMAIMLIISCGKGDDSENPDPDPDTNTTNMPGKAVATLPANGEPCSEYDAVVGDATKARIKFSWHGASKATSYILKIKEQETLVVDKTISGTSNFIILDKGKTYVWTVTAKNSDGETLSDTNSFTTPGEPIGNYVPYAAVITFSVDDMTDMASLSWVGSDQDTGTGNLSFDVLITENTNELILLEDVTQTSIADFSVVSHATYQIKIKTSDQYGSYSISILNHVYE